MSGWDNLGAVMGGELADNGGDSEAYLTGRYRTAQTEGALANARLNMLKATSEAKKQAARAGVEAALVANGATPTAAHEMATIMQGELGSDYRDVQAGRATQQEMGFRDVVANGATDNATRQRNLAAISGKPFSPLEAVGSGTYTDITAVNPTVMSTPLGQAEIATQRPAQAENYAQADKARRETTDGGKPESGFEVNPDYDPTVTDPADPRYGKTRAVTGGSKDPNIGAPLGARERVIISSVVHSGMESAQRVHNIMRMPAEVSSGLFGSGSLKIDPMSAVKNNMLLKLNDTDINNYNALMLGQARNVANLESMGRYSPSEAQISTIYQQLALKSGDSLETKMMRMADYRNMVENALRTTQMMVGNQLPSDVRAELEHQLASIKEAVPFTIDNVTDLQTTQRTKPRATLREVMSQRMATAPAPKAGGAAPPAGPAAPPAAAAAPGAPRAFATEEEAAAAAAAGQLQSGDRITVGGQPGTWH